MANFFDQFDAQPQVAQASPPQGGNFFDQFDAQPAPAQLSPQMSALQNAGQLSGDSGPQAVADMSPENKAQLNAIAEHIRGLAPQSWSDVPRFAAGMVSPLPAAYDQIRQSAGMVGDVAGGATAQQAAEKEAPESQILKKGIEAGVGSPEFAGAVTDLGAQAVMAGLIAHGLSAPHAAADVEKAKTGPEPKPIAPTPPEGQPEAIPVRLEAQPAPETPPARPRAVSVPEPRSPEIDAENARVLAAHDDEEPMTPISEQFRQDDAARAAADRHASGQPMPPEEAAGSLTPDQPGFVLDDSGGRHIFKEGEEPWKITQAAIRDDKTGEIYTGASHSEIWDNMGETYRQIYKPDEFTHGYVDRSGKFLTREEGEKPSWQANKPPETESPESLPLKTQQETSGRQTPADNSGQQTQPQSQPSTTVLPAEAERPDSSSSNLSESRKSPQETGNQPEPIPRQPAATGVSHEALQETYGDIERGKVKSPEQLKAEGQNWIAKGGDPAPIIQEMRNGNTPSPEDFQKVRAEHNRLVDKAVASEGTSEYGSNYDAARNLAQLIKEHGTRLGEGFRGLQGSDPIKLDSMTGFDLAMNDRMGREMTPSERAAAKPIADRIRGLNGEEARDIADRQVAAERSVPLNKRLDPIELRKSLADLKEQLLKDCLI